MEVMSNYRLFAQAYRRQAWRTCPVDTTSTSVTALAPRHRPPMTRSCSRPPDPSPVGSGTMRILCLRVLACAAALTAACGLAGCSTDAAIDLNALYAETEPW